VEFISADLPLSNFACVTPWSRVVREKLLVARLITISPVFYGIRRCITVSTTARHWTLSWVTWIQSTTSHTFDKILFNIVFQSTPRFPKLSLPFRFLEENFVCIYHLSNACYLSDQSHPLWFVHPNNNWWRVQNYEASHCAMFSVLLLPNILSPVFFLHFKGRTFLKVLRKICGH